MESLVSAFNDRFDGLTGDQRQARYRALAAAALTHYALDEPTVTFVGHNAGVSYRVDTPRTGRRFLLKIAEPVGEGDGGEPARVHSTLLWLAALARETELVVQEPVPNRQGELLTPVFVDDLPAPFYCSLQQWVDGDHVAGDFTPAQTHRIGVTLATLHQHGSRWVPVSTLAADELDAPWVSACEQRLRRVVDEGNLPSDVWNTVAEACRRVCATMDALGRQPEVWGPVHRDLHHRNVLFRGDQVWPIDFGAFTRAHFSYDLGVTLYHVMYQEDVSVRRALLAGYHSKRPRVALGPLEAEAFLCAAALSNLAFQVTIPRQRASPLFAHNVREFATVFCSQLVEGQPFVFAADVADRAEVLPLL